jgi:hypothetical protein
VKTTIAFVLLSLISAAAMAGGVGGEFQPPASVPEPGILGLFATAGVMLFLARKFRK